MSEELPKISVVIYNHNAGIYAGRLLKFLHKDQYVNLELAVIDDGSKDDSVDQIKHTVLENEIRNAHLYQLPKHQGKTAAYNLALEKITGDYVIFTSAMDEMDKNFIRSLSTTFKSKAFALTGFYDNTKKKNVPCFCTPTKDRKDDETFKAYFARLKKHDARFAPIFNKIFDMEVIRDKDLKFTNTKSASQKFVDDYIKAAEIERIVTINKPLYTHNSK